MEVIKNNVYRDQDANNIITLPEHHLAVENLKSTMSMTLLAPLSDYSETVRRIRVAFDNYFAPKNAKRGAVIGFLSDGGTETRSTLAMNYAEMVAVGGQRTLMIDFDWLESFLSRTITPSAAFGLPDLMFSGENFRPEQVFWLDERTGMFFLPNRSMDKRDTIDPAVFDTARLLKLIDCVAPLVRSDRYRFRLALGDGRCRGLVAGRGRICLQRPVGPVGSQGFGQNHGKQWRAPRKDRWCDYGGRVRERPVAL